MKSILILTLICFTFNNVCAYDINTNTLSMIDNKESIDGIANGGYFLDLYYKSKVKTSISSIASMAIITTTSIMYTNGNMNLSGYTYANIPSLIGLTYATINYITGLQYLKKASYYLENHKKLSLNSSNNGLSLVYRF